MHKDKLKIILFVKLRILTFSSLYRSETIRNNNKQNLVKVTCYVALVKTLSFKL